MSRASGTAFFVLGLLFFLMPWVSVQCGDNEVQLTGLNLAVGTNVEVEGRSDRVPPEVLATAAIILAIAGAGLFFVRGKRGDLARAAIGAAGAIILVSLKFKVENDLRATASEVEGTIEQSIVGMIQLNWEVGFWLALLSFVAAAGSQALLWQMEKEGWRLEKTIRPGNP